VNTSRTRPAGTTSPNLPSNGAGVDREQPLRLVVDQRDPARRIDGDRPLADAVEHRFSLLEQGADLVGLQSERLPLYAAREQEGADNCERERHEHGEG